MARIDDGYQTLVSFASAPSVQFYQKTVTPPGMDGGGEVDTTTMLNETYRTRNPKPLITMSNMSMTAAYDPGVYDSILSLINVNNLITVTFPDGATLAFYGWLNSFTPGECTEGTQPTATVDIIPSNQDESGVETAPVYTAASS
jgi:hypothetical protein